MYQKEGDIIWMNFNPQSGHERAGHRPALVLSPSSYNKATSLLVCCPMTTQIKGILSKLKFQEILKM